MSIWLFPGQGSQTPGMGRDFFEQSSAARAIFEEAEALAPEGFLNLIFEGSADELSKTENAQPALLTVETAISAHLRDTGQTPNGCAGHSLGEFSALVAAGVLSFEAAFKLVSKRGQLMADLTPEGSMAAVVGMDADTIEANLPDGVTVANFNGPGQTIISGTLDGIEQAQTVLKEAGAKRVLPLKVSGPFHSPYMTAAAEAFEAELANVQLASPTCQFVSSVTASVLDTPDAIRAALSKQMLAAVRWTEVMTVFGQVPALEVGPGRVLQGIAKRADNAPDVALAGNLEG